MSILKTRPKQRANGDQEQLHRINIAGARLGLFSKDESRRFLLDAALAAERDGFFETAYLRHCIAAFLADIVSALNEQKIVLISCHGRIVSTEQGNRFLFDLTDGNHAPDELIKNSVAAPFVILSACSSGVYEMAVGDYPVGAAPEFILAGARFCICTRFPISAYFTKAFFPTFGRLLKAGCSVGVAFARTLQEVETQGYDRWLHLACVELLGRGISDSK